MRKNQLKGKDESKKEKFGPDVEKYDRTRTQA
jgi:hypothetical protein